MNNNISWELVKSFYSDKFGIDKWVVEMYANMDILSLCVSGASNKSIENILEIPIDEVKLIIKDVFEFDGWEKDLPINPYRMFCSYDGEISSVVHFNVFVSDVLVELGKYSGFESVKAEKIFYMCETMYNIERKIRDEWI